VRGSKGWQAAEGPEEQHAKNPTELLNAEENRPGRTLEKEDSKKRKMHFNQPRNLKKRIIS